MIKKTKHVAELLYKGRALRRMSQAECGKKLGYTQKGGQFISNIERGLSQIPVKKVITLAVLLDIPAQTIIDAMIRDYAECLSSEVFNADDVLTEDTY